MVQKKTKTKAICLLLLSFAAALFPAAAPSWAVRTAQAASSSRKSPKPARVKRLRVKQKKKGTTLSWKAVSKATGYEIWRSTSKKGRFKRLKRQKKAHISIQSKKPYYYKVRAYKKSGRKITVGKFSKTILIAPVPVAPAPATPAPVSPTPVSPTPVSPTPVSPTPVPPAPIPPAPVPPHTHTFSEWTERTAATCTAQGEKARTCTVCSTTETEAIPALGHDFNEWIEKEGYSERSCIMCGKTELRTDMAVDGSIVVFQNNDPVMGTLEGETFQIVEENSETSQVTAVPNIGYQFDHWSNGSTDPSITVSVTENTLLTAYFRIEELELPIMQIETDNREEVVEKKLYLPCSITVSNAETAYEFENKRGKIRGRGNSTWNFDKKPYKLKFESKTDLFGNGAAKTWTLIANYYDRSLIRNELAYKIGAQFDYIKDTTTTVQSVELYFNGVYQGVYLICEQNEVGKTRVNIEDSLTIDPADTGYLLELNDSASLEDDGIEGRDWFRVNNLPYVIKSPDLDEVPDENEIYKYVNYIKDYMQECNDALASGNYESVQQYLDIDTFADSYILNELFKSLDVGVSSFFLYKDTGGKLCSGPVWDYDVTCGNWAYSDSRYSNVLWAKEKNYWYTELLKYDEFVQLVSQRLADYKDRITNTINESIDELSDLENSFLRNFERWDIMGQQIWYEPLEIKDILTWQGQVEYVKNWLEESLNYMLSVYS